MMFPGILERTLDSPAGQSSLAVHPSRRRRLASHPGPAGQSSPHALLGMDDRFGEILASVLAAGCRRGMAAHRLGCSYRAAGAGCGDGADHGTLSADGIGRAERARQLLLGFRALPRISCRGSCRPLAGRISRHRLVLGARLVADSGCGSRLIADRASGRNPDSLLASSA